MECVTCSIKCEMYERMLKMQEKEIERLHQLLLQSKNIAVTNKQSSVLPSQQLFATIAQNLDDLSDEEIIKYLTSPFPATQSLLNIMNKIFKGKHTQSRLCNVVNQTFIEYIAEDKIVKKENYNFLLDRIFKDIYQKCKSASYKIHDNVNNEQQNILSDHFHDNIMIFNSNTTQKRKLQKELLNVIKNDAFSN